MVTPRNDGTDTSHWNTLTNSKLAFAYPLGSLKATEGKFYKDYTFPARWRIMREQGVKYRGAYHWVRPDFSIADQAANFIKTIEANGGLLKGEFVQIDWEVTLKNGVALPVPTSRQIAEFQDRLLQRFGRPSVIVYSSDWLPDSTLDADSRREFIEWREENPDFPLWYANYNIGTGSQGGWIETTKYGADVWQWSSTRIVPGWAAGVDVNHVFSWKTLDIITNQLIIPQPALIDPVVGATGVRMLYCYIDPNGTVWVGNGLARRALDNMDQFAQYVYLSTTNGGPRLLSGGGVAVTGIAGVSHVDGITIEALGKPI